MVTRFESTRWNPTVGDERLVVELSNGATADLQAREDWDGKPVIRWRLALTPPAGLEWAESLHYGAAVLLGPRPHLAMVATAWILVWSGGNLDVSDHATETAAALTGLRI